MTATPGQLLTLYCIAVTAASLAGGLLPTRVQMTHTRTQLVMSFVSGLMLGVAFYHLLPHSITLFDSPRAPDLAAGWLMIGLVSLFLLLRMFHFHQHDFSHEEADHHEHAHGAVEVVSVHRLSWLGLALGLGVHTLIDGVALGAVMQGAVNDASAGLLGIGVFLAILLHKPLDAMSVTTVMEAGGWSRAACRNTNILFALLCPLGALLFYLGVDLLGPSRDHAIAAAMAFSAGAFICIALSDLLPEVHFHSHDRFALTLAFLLGIGLAYAIGGLEPAGFHPPTP